MNKPKTVADHFRNQHGVATDRQVRAAGVTWEQQRTMLRRGRWIRSAPGVLALGGAPQSWHQRAMIATLSCGGSAMLASAAAARLHQLDGFLDVDDVIVVMHAGRRNQAPDGVDVRWSKMISAKDRHVIDHIPVAILPLTLMQLVIDDLTADQALDSALRQKTSPTWLRREFERWLPVRGSGASRMLDLLEQWSGKRLPRSWFQRLAKQLFEAEGVQLEEEWPVQDAKGGLIAELDLAHVELKVGVECQSIQWHGAVSSRARDTERARKLRRLGWEIVEVWWADLHRSESVLADLQLALRKARQLRPHEDFGVADVAT